MPAKCVADPLNGFLVTQASGVVLIAEVIAALDAFLATTQSEFFYRPHLFLVDDQARLDQLSFEALLELRNALERWASRYPGRRTKTAVVVYRSDHLAVAKEWQAVSKVNPLVGAEVRIFTDQSLAEGWLKI